MKGRRVYVVHKVDSEWIGGWVQRWGDKMVQFAFMLTDDRDTAQDVAQEAFLKLHAYHQRHPGQDPTVGWLYTVTKNLARDTMRKGRHERPGLDDTLQSSDSFESSLAVQLAVQRALRELSTSDQDILGLFYFADYSVEQVAHELRLSVGTVRTRLHRARKRFEAVWEGFQDAR